MVQWFNGGNDRGGMEVKGEMWRWMPTTGQACAETKGSEAWRLCLGPPGHRKELQ